MPAALKLPADYRERLFVHFARDPLHGVSTAHVPLGMAQRTYYWHRDRNADLAAAVDEAQAACRQAIAEGAVVDWLRRNGWRPAERGG